MQEQKKHICQHRCLLCIFLILLPYPYQLVRALHPGYWEVYDAVREFLSVKCVASSTRKATTLTAKSVSKKEKGALRSRMVKKTNFILSYFLLSWVRQPPKLKIMTKKEKERHKTLQSFPLLKIFAFLSYQLES